MGVLWLEDALRAAREETAAARQAAKVVLASASHDLRAPIATLLGMGDLLEETAPTPDQLPLIRTLKQAAGDLLALADDYLDLSLMEAGRFDVARTPFCPRALAAGVVEGLLATSRERGVTLGWDVDPAVPAVLAGDRDRLQRILTHLAGHAMRVPGVGEVRLRVSSLEPSRIRLVVMGLGRDRGEGAGSALADRSREPATPRLTICRQLLERMGGSLRMERMPNGDVLCDCLLALPALAAPAPVLVPGVGTPAPSDDSDQPAGKALRILLVDDSSENRLFLETLLRGTSHRLRSATNGLKGLAAFQEETWDLVIMDIRMPEMDGCEATRRIRALETLRGTARVPVVAMTASVLEEEQQRCLEAGCDLHLAKPVSRIRLFDLLQRIQSAAPMPEWHGLVQSPVLLAGGNPIDPATFASLHRQLKGNMAPLLDEFLRVIPLHLEKMAAALQHNAQESFITAAHNLKGGARTLGADGLYRLAHDCEEQARSGLRMPDPSALHALEAEADRVMARIRELLENDREPGVGG
ncbi:MAG: response regulator [Magnetococcales bacterium]|nr:response regulator [Magnetococcales bacterium]